MGGVRNIEKVVALGILAAIIIFNIYLHSAELTIRNDPNDNIFQYALVDEAKDIWKDVFAGKLSPFYLFDSHNERWNEGFALSTYYSHLPQAAIALVSLIFNIDSFGLFKFLKFIILILLPLHFFISARILKLSYFYAVILAVFSQLVITDGLYGIDITSFLWRGWGLSSQLMAVFFLPVAFAYSYRYLTDGKYLIRAILANFLLAQTHSGIFFMMALSYPIILIFNFQLLIVNGQWSVVNGQLSVVIKRFLVFIGLVGFSLSYYLIPFFLYSDFRNFSLWDSLWKFNSWGIFPVVTYLLNGDLFDFGRLPILTYLAIFGVFYGLASDFSKSSLFRVLSVLFIFYFILFFGRAGLGRVIDLIPGFSEFHLHRFVVMVQFVGIYLASAAVIFIAEQFKVFSRGLSYPRPNPRIGNSHSVWDPLRVRHPLKHLFSGLTNLFFGFLFLILILVTIYLYKPILKYSSENSKMIANSNKLYEKDFPDYIKIVEKLRTMPTARVYAGRPGNWGREFKIGDTTVYMALSRDGFAGVGFPPESWSPNTEYDQFFDEQGLNFYNLFNVGYIVAPDSFKTPEFARQIAKSGKFILYKVEPEGYFTLGTSYLRFTGKKTSFFNMTRFWMGSEFLRAKNYPVVDYKNELDVGERKYELLDLNNYKVDGAKKNMWVENPFVLSDFTKKELETLGNVVNYEKGKEEFLPQSFKTSISLKNDCKYCILVLKQTYHPNWEVKIINAPTEVGYFTSAIPVFPFYIGIPVSKAGEYTIEATYKPNGLKVILIVVEIIGFAGIIGSLSFPRKRESI